MPNESGYSGVYDGSDRGDILAKPKKLADAPKRVWRRETLHTLEGRVSPCPNTVRQGGSLERAARINIPLEAREMRVHVTAVTVGRHRSNSSWRIAPQLASVSGGSAVSISPKEACVGTMDGACTWRDGERVNEASTRSPNDLEFSTLADCAFNKRCTRKRHGGTRSRSSSAFASQGRKSCDLSLWEVGLAS